MVAAEAVQIIAAFDAARLAAFGEETEPRFPTQTDRIDAARWLKAGAEAGMAPVEVVDLCAGVFGAVHTRMAGRGRRPPRSLAIHNNDIADAIARRNQPLPPGHVEHRSGASRPATAAGRTSANLKQWDSLMSDLSSALSGALVTARSAMAAPIPARVSAMAAAFAAEMASRSGPERTPIREANPAVLADAHLMALCEAQIRAGGPLAAAARTRLKFLQDRVAGHARRTSHDAQDSTSNPQNTVEIGR